jgi:hypothetical protein
MFPSSRSCICCAVADWPCSVRANHSIAAPQSQLTNAVWLLAVSGCEGSACGCLEAALLVLAAGPELRLVDVEEASNSGW